MSTLLTKLGRASSIPLLIFAVEYLAHGRWQGGMPPIPPWTHGEHIFSYVTGALLLVISMSLLINKEARLSATILGLLFLFCVVFLQAAKHFSGIIYDGGIRTRAFGTFALGGAAFVSPNTSRFARFRPNTSGQISPTAPATTRTTSATAPASFSASAPGESFSGLVNSDGVQEKKASYYRL